MPSDTIFRFVVDTFYDGSLPQYPNWSDISNQCLAVTQMIAFPLIAIPLILLLGFVFSFRGRK